MDQLKKLVGREVGDELDYFNAVWQTIAPQGKVMSLGDLLHRSYILYPDNIALIFQDRFMTYRELYFHTVQFSFKLRDKGINPRDRVLLFYENSLEFYIAYFGIIQIGAVIAPLNTFLHENELNHIIQDAQPVAAVLHSSHKDLFKTYEAHNKLEIFTEHDLNTDYDVLKEIPPFPIYHLEPEEMATLLYTSGTTGMPKGVMLSSKNIMTNLVQALARFNFRETERLLGILPLFHSFAQNACIWLVIFTGSSVIVVPKIERRHIFAALKHNPTIVLGVPALFGLFCLLKTLPFDGVKWFVSGGDAMPDKIRAAFGLLYRRKICNGYGMTESSPVISADFDDVAQPTNTIGRAAVHLEIKIIDDAGNRLRDGLIGQLIVKGGNVMLGYYNAPEITAQTIKNGWLYTGDLAYIDPSGKIVITGRIKDLISHKGIKIYPQEIENIILTHPNVIRVGVVGKVEENTGEIPVAFVQIRTKEDNIERKLKELCLMHLASYKIPRDFFVTTEDLPATATGKVDKKVLRKRLV